MNPKRFHTYGTESVAERDSVRRGKKFSETARMCLLPLYALLGLHWSGAQRRLARLGFVPRAMTGTSIFTVFCPLFTQGVFAVVMINTTSRSGIMMVGGMIRAMTGKDQLHIGHWSIPIPLLDTLLLLVLLADVIMRYARYLRDDELSGGFLEWAVPSAFRKKQTKAVEARSVRPPDVPVR